MYTKREILLSPKCTYIVKNIKFIYTSFDEFFLPVSQRMEMNYIFSDNICILYLSWYVKSPTETVKLSKKSRNKRRSYRFWLCQTDYIFKLFLQSLKSLCFISSPWLKFRVGYYLSLVSVVYVYQTWQKSLGVSNSKLYPIEKLAKVDNLYHFICTQEATVIVW